MKFKKIGHYVAQYKVLIGSTMLLSICAAAIAAVSPWPLKLLVDYAFTGNALPSNLAALSESFPWLASPMGLAAAAAAASFTIFLANSLVQFALEWNWAVLGQRLIRQVAADLFSKMQRLSLNYHSKQPVGDSLNRIAGDAWCINNIVLSLFTAPVQHLFTLATIGLIAWNMDARLTLIMLVTAPALGVSTWFFSGRLKNRALLNRQAQSQVMNFVQQTLTSIPVVQAFGTENQNRNRFDRLASNLVIRSQRDQVMREAFSFTNGLSLTAGAAIIIYAGGERVLAGGLTLGSLLVFIAYMKSLQSASESLLRAYGNIKSWEASWDRVLEVLDSEDKVSDRPGAVDLDKSATRGLQLDNISFGYEAEQPVLQDINLAVNAGETLALVGPTGAGKSTLVAMIPRFFDPWSGRLLIDGQDLRDIRIASLREQISIVLQEPFLLPLTIAENIAYGRPGASLEEIRAAAKAARIDEYIEGLPEGYTTPVGERGATLSGGQRQRLSIARALLKDAPILIMDEPTSALDADTEAQLLAALRTLMRNRTTIIIAHRLSTIRHADQIAFLDEGRVVESGTHDELIHNNGPYARFHSLQSNDHALGIVA